VLRVTMVSRIDDRQFSGVAAGGVIFGQQTAEADVGCRRDV
jgi:hypothetical protein